MKHTFISDFPAAHSMDTAWYAIDAEGHVAIFSTSEDGHMPKGAPSDFDDYSLLDELLTRLGPERFKLDPIKLPEVPLVTEKNLSDYIARRSLRHVLVIIRSLDDLNRPEWMHKSYLRRIFGGPLRRCVFALLRVSDPVMVWIRDPIPRRDAERLVRDGVIQYIFNDSDFWESPVRDFAAWLGLYHYGYRGDPGDLAYRYHLEETPEHPIQLNESEWRELGFGEPHSKFPTIRFVSQPNLQPFEFSPCTGYSESVAYVVADGNRILPVPGMENEFESQKDRFQDEEELLSDENEIGRNEELKGKDDE